MMNISRFIKHGHIIHQQFNHPFKRRPVLLTKNISVSNTHQFLIESPIDFTPLSSPVMSQHGAARTHGKLQESTWRVTHQVRRSQAAGVYGLPKLENPTYLRFDQITITVVFAILVGKTMPCYMPFCHPLKRNFYRWYGYHSQMASLLQYLYIYIHMMGIHGDSQWLRIRNLIGVGI